MLFCCYLINISKVNTSSDNEKESQEVLLTSNKFIYACQNEYIRVYHKFEIVFYLNFKCR